MELNNQAERQNKFLFIEKIFGFYFVIDDLKIEF